MAPATTEIGPCMVLSFEVKGLQAVVTYAIKSQRTRLTIQRMQHM
jgi:hypothetical protein